MLAIALVSWLAIPWTDRKDRVGSEWLLVLAVYVMALGSTNHLMSVPPAPAVALLVLCEKPGLFLHRGMWVQTAAAVSLGLSLSLFLPIRSTQDPVINEGGADLRVGRGRGGRRLLARPRGGAPRSPPI